MKTSKLLILPSYSEAYPTVLLEAAACGTPFLASNIAGIPDIVEESGCGQMFDVGNISMLSMLIEKILEDDIKWQEMSDNGKAWVNNLTEEKIKNKWLEVYNSLGHY
jgi:glycosyltransferase involved in cell wall biosynthesis